MIVNVTDGGVDILQFSISLSMFLSTFLNMNYLDFHVSPSKKCRQHQRFDAVKCVDVLLSTFYCRRFIVDILSSRKNVIQVDVDVDGDGDVCRLIKNFRCRDKLHPR
jgi:hypothetical protein